ncbi:aromatic acid exporter family protein [Actinotalea sp. Marseille-Q4924]|uniref:FUSC family protein n=1 Tax=Actinotalea sp. Marseille-Q4924 TaxID=2866571 RepID=UPI001CE442BB|nr:hypothetical protein [Actinotalea sp. Marseille-Q4924]
MPHPRPTGLRPGRRALRLLRHPRTTLAGKTALAALVAWLVALQVPGAADYTFYAPFGAVATMHPAVSRSAAEAMRGLTAIVLGGALGLLGDQLLGPHGITLALLVGAGILVGGLPWLGESRSYVPLAAVFVLLVGQGDEVSYAASYAGLFLLGGVVSIAVNAALPTLPLGPADEVVRALRAEVVAHLRFVALHLDDDDCEAPLTEHGPGRAELRRRLSRAGAVVGEFDEAAVGNLRARRHPELVSSRSEEYRALERAVLLIDDLYGLSADQPWGTPVGGVSRELRAPIAAALRELADAIREIALDDREPGRRARVDDAVQRLVVALARHEERHGADAEALVVATVVTTLRRTLSALTPEGVRLSTGPLPKPGVSTAPSA